MSTTTADPTVTTHDLRPLHIKIADAIKDEDNQNKALSLVGATAGGVAGAAIAYLGVVVSWKFLESIGMAAWYMNLAYWSGAVIIGAYTAYFAWTGYNLVRHGR